MASGKISWSDVTSPKELEGGPIYKGGASQSQPPSPPKVD